MRWIWKVVIALLVFVCILPFFIRGKNGKPLLSLDRLQAPKIVLPDTQVARELLDKTREKVREHLPETPAKPGRMYKWRDARGTVHLSDQPNPDGPCELLLVNPNTNIMPSVKTTAAAAPACDKKGALASLTAPALTTIPLADIPRLVDQAKEAGNLPEQRERALEKQIGQ
jgi:hypothetical protein